MTEEVCKKKVLNSNELLSNPLVYKILPSGPIETLLCTAESGSIKLESLAL